MGVDLHAVQARYNDWYGEDDGEPLFADWSMRDDMESDEPESLSHCIVRNDVPELIAEVDLLSAALRRIAPHEYARLHPPSDIRELIERGSLGTPEAKAIRASVPREQVARVLSMARAYEVEQAVILDRPLDMPCSPLEPYDFGAIIPGACLVDVDPSEWRPL